MPSDPKLKRKAQNRAAQRAFRERKEQFVNELQQQLLELKREKEKREQELLRENARLQEENKKLKKENSLLKSESALTYQPSSPSFSDDLTVESNDMSPLTCHSEKNRAWLDDTVLFTASDEVLSDFQGTLSLTHSTISTPKTHYSPLVLQHQYDCEERNGMMQTSPVGEQMANDEYQSSYPLDQTSTMTELFGSEINMFDQPSNMNRIDSYFF
ncbi:hypothetical protein EDC96DRAFT_494282 [Choanephora cucurbitarum]|nr:hypothetical protein EDC96DRAFT_494282 [Choanephora cucurbitarum]